MAHLVPGCLHPSNGKDSIDWNTNGLLAYGSHSVVIIVNVAKFKRIQCLDFHQTAINVVRWSPSKSPFSESTVKSHEFLASSDISGQIIVTNVMTATKIQQFSHPNSAVLQMFWYPWKDLSRDLLLALHSSSTLVLWNTATGEKVWSHTYNHVPLFDFSIDPFAIKNVTFSSSGNKISVTSDIGLSEPAASGHLFQVVSDENNSSNNNMSNIYMVVYHKAYRNMVFVAIGGNFYLFNPELMCILSKIPIESNIIAWLPLSRRDAAFAVHSNGAATLRIGRFDNSDEKRPNSAFVMDKVCQTECIRHGNSQRIVGAVLCPTTQATIAVIYQNGKLAFWQLKNAENPLIYRASFIEDYLEFDTNLVTKQIGDLSLHQIGKMPSLSSGVTCVRMRPMDELAKVENDPFANTELGTLHLAAIGTNSGNVHLVDVFTSQIYKDICVQASPIKCLEWGGVYSLVTAGYNHSLSASQIVRNDLFITDIRTGVGRRIRPEIDESPISIIRVSYYHCYLALAFQREPLEIWDLKGLRMLRRMSRSCPLIIDMAWSNKHHSIKTTEATQQSVYRENLVLLDSENRIYHITLRGLHVRDGKMVNTQWKSASAQICAMAWKDDMLAVGDVEGSLVVWDLGRRQSRQVRDVSHSRVLRMTFSRLAGDHTMAVLHSKEVTLWDTEAMTRLQSLRTDSSRLCLDLDLCGLSPIVLSNDNQFRCVVSNSKNAAVSDKDVPLQYQDDVLSSIREKLEQNTGKMLEKVSDDEGVDVDEISEAINEECALKWLAKRKFENPATISGCDLTNLMKELLIRRFIGDHFAADLLSIVIDRFAGELRTNNLTPDLQMFWENLVFKERESRVICIACGSEDAMERRLVEQAVVVGGAAKEKVTDRLIVSADLRYASIKAALLVSSQENEKAKSLIKLIATNLIASDLIEDGVELLFLVGAGNDACKYLQSQKLWTKSIVYAKMGLEDPSEVEAKWIAHLAEEAKQIRVLAEAARQNWPDVVEALSSIDPGLARLILRTTTSTPPVSTCSTPP